MNRFIKIALVSAVAFFASNISADAQILKNLLNRSDSNDTEEVVTPVSNGRAAGAALKALFTQYKLDGKLDMTNLNNILNLTSLANNVKDLKGQDSKSTFYKDFVKGLISGSGNLVTNTNSNAIMNGLSSLVNNVDLSALTQQAEDKKDNIMDKIASASGKADTAIGNANEIAESVSSILNLFK